MYFTKLTPQNLPGTPVSSVIFEIGPLTGAGPVKRPGRTGSSNDNIFSIVWVISGRGHCGVDRLEYELGDRQLICLGPGRDYSVETSPQLEGFLIRFTGAFLETGEQAPDLSYQDDLYWLFSTPVAMTVKEEMVEEMKAIAARMVTENENLFLYRSQIIRKYLRIFLIYLSRHHDRQSAPMINTQSVQLVQKFMVMLEKDFRTVRSVNGYASQLAITPNHLNVIVKRHTRRPAGYHIRQRIVQEAKKLALYSDVCMKEIAYLLGFSDTAHFSKFFKKSTGINFSEFKRRREPEAALAG